MKTGIVSDTAGPGGSHTFTREVLVLGSSSPALSQQTSKSLAGRSERILMSGFTLADAGSAVTERHLLRGGYPLSYPGLACQFKKAPGTSAENSFFYDSGLLHQLLGIR